MEGRAAAHLLAGGFSGGCPCGAVRYRTPATPRFGYICHCTDCRRFSGTAFHTGIAIDAAGFEVLAETPARHALTADSGHEITRSYCASCGGALWSATTADPSLISVKAGTVTSHDADLLRPEIQIWVDSRVAWLPLPQGLESYRRGLRGERPIHPARE